MLKNSKMAQFWKTIDELTKNVSISLMKQIIQKPAIGWTRQAGPSTDELNRRLVDLQSKYDACKAELDIIQIRNIDEVLSGELQIDYQITSNHKVLETKQLTISWADVFWKLGEKFEEGMVHPRFIINSILPKPIKEAFNNILNEADKKVIAHLFNLGIIDSFHREYAESSIASQRISHRKELVWTLTELGKKIYYAKLALC